MKKDWIEFYVWERVMSRLYVLQSTMTKIYITGAITRGVLVSGPTAYKIANSLEERGLIKTYYEGRIRVIELTEKGKIIAKKIHEVIKLVEGDNKNEQEEENVNISSDSMLQ